MERRGREEEPKLLRSVKLCQAKTVGKSFRLELGTGGKHCRGHFVDALCAIVVSELQESASSR